MSNDKKDFFLLENILKEAKLYCGRSVEISFPFQYVYATNAQFANITENWEGEDGNTCKDKSDINEDDVVLAVIIVQLSNILHN